MPDGTLIFRTEVDNKKALAELQRLTKQIDAAKAKLNEQTGKQSAIGAELKAATTEANKTGDSIERLKKELATLQFEASPSNTAGVGNPAALMANLERQKAIKTEISQQNALLRQQDAEAARLGTQYARITDQVNTTRGQLETMNTQAGGLSEQMTAAGGATASFGDAVKGAEQKVAKLGKRITGLVKRVFFFSLITMALRGVRQWFSNLIKTNDEATAAIARLKGALLTMAQPLVNVVIPAFVTLINVLTRVISAIASLIAMLTGGSVEAYADQAKSLYEESNALDAVGGSAKDAGKQMASFDEINQLQDTGGGGGGGSGNKIEPNFDFMENLGLEKIQGILEKILPYVEAIGIGLLAWKIGSSLFPNMKTALGLAMALAGAFLLVKGYIDAWQNGINWENLTQMVAGLALVVAGLAIAFGSLAAGIALVVGGVALLVLGIKEWITTGELSTETFAALEIGILAVAAGLALITGSWIPLAIGAVVGLALAIYKYWGQVKTFLTKTMDSIKRFFSTTWESIKGYFQSAWERAQEIWSIAATWFDEHVIQPIIRFFSPIVTTLSKIFEGCWILVKAAWVIASTWFNENVVQPIIKFFSPITETVGGFFTQLWDDIKVVWDKVAGWFDENVISSLKTSFDTVTDDIYGFFDTLWTDIKEIFSTVSEWLSENVITPITTAWDTAFGGLETTAKTIFNNILGFFETILNAIIGGVNGFLSGFNNLVTKAGKVIGKDWSPIGQFGYVSLPRLAQGAVIPPNREFMAVLGDQKQGTNIETPLATMVAAFKQALAESGGGGQVIENILTLDGEIIYQNQKRIAQRQGNTLVRIGGV